MKFCVKSFAVGMLAATLSVATVFAAGGIKSAEFNANKVVFDGKELDLNGQALISVINEGEEDAYNYMPVRSVLGAMGYEVSWDGNTNTVNIETKKASAKPEVTAEKPAEAAKPAEVKPADIVKPVVAKPATDAAVSTSAKGLIGTWVGTQDNGDIVEYTFSEAGVMRAYAKSAKADYDLQFTGTYKVNGNHLEFNYEYLYGKDVKTADLPDKIKLDEEFKLSADGKVLTLQTTDEDTGKVYSLALNKVNKPVELEGTKVPQREDIVGVWSTKVSGVSMVYTFGQDRSLTLITEEGDEDVFFYGTYDIHNGKLELTFSKMEISNLTGNKVYTQEIKESYLIGINKDKQMILTDSIFSAVFDRI